MDLSARMSRSADRSGGALIAGAAGDAVDGPGSAGTAPAAGAARRCSWATSR
ncbi:hypothetical protein [Mycobacterium riyadhense]|uniref:hypothetical protein n=1 Tax=Mycobacterium riyadhense TaxID=486698 RepID=UPI00194F82CB|nr:hypothetical protein [Mycobacterium riyadhense]